MYFDRLPLYYSWPKWLIVCLIVHIIFGFIYHDFMKNKTEATAIIWEWITKGFYLVYFYISVIVVFTLIELVITSIVWIMLAIVLILVLIFLL